MRVFVSSPSDVNPEREVVRRVVQRMDREFFYHFRVEPLLFERLPLVATGDFQENIPPPSSTDIVVVVLWSRLGTYLDQEKYEGKVTGKVPVTGTEWEFEDAVHGYRTQNGKPDLLLYRKDAEIVASLSDDEALEQKRRQKKLVEEFIQHWIQDWDRW